jgi:hypothetical protein
VRASLAQDRHAARLDVEALAVLAPRVRLEHHLLAGQRALVQAAHVLVQRERAHRQLVGAEGFLALAAAHRLVGRD